MKIYDISLPLHDHMIVYPGDPQFKLHCVSSIEDGSSSKVSVIEMGSHTGTHIDAPAHMLSGGASIDALPLNVLVGPTRVIDMRRINGHIEARQLDRLNWQGVKRVLFKTRNSARWGSEACFDKGFVALTGDAAGFLVSKKVTLVGVDGLSVDRFKSGNHPAHMELLKAGIVIVEGLNLDGVPAGNYTLLCAPLSIANADGAPARVFLIK